jgi:hypothetical protein
VPTRRFLGLSRPRATPPRFYTARFGWFGRLALTLPLYLLLYGLGKIMGMGTKIFVLTVGGPMFFFIIWWTVEVWRPPRRR